MATTLENHNLANQAVALLASARRDIRATCLEADARVVAGEWTMYWAVRAVASQGNALATLLAKVATHQADIETAVLQVSILPADMVADYQLLNTAAVAMRDCTEGNVANVVSQILIDVVETIVLW